MKTKLFAATLVSFVVFSCSKKVVAPVASTDVKTTEVIQPELPTAIAEGKMLYENSCARCHKLFPVTKHDKSGWSTTVNKMAPKAKLTDVQKDLVYNYLTYGM